MKLEGHEVLTKVGMKDFKKNKMIDPLDETLEGIVAGSRWNDLLHNASIVQLGLSLVIAGVTGRESSLPYASHNGQLQFLHSMAACAAEQAWQTRHKIMLWAEFCYRTGTGDLPITTHLDQVDAFLSLEEDFHCGPTFAEMFRPWKNHSIGWLFSGSNAQFSDSKIRGMAVGSLLHTLQDSFCMSHTQRVAAKKAGEPARAIRGFNVYPEQSSNPLWGAHGMADIVQGDRRTPPEERVAMTAGAQEAVEAAAGVLDLYSRMAGWEEVKQYLQGILRLAPELEAQIPADRNWNGTPAEPAQAEEEAKGRRMVSAAGRLFRKHNLLEIFKKTFGRTSLLEPREVTRLRSCLSAYNDELNTQRKTLTVKISLDQLYGNFLLPQANALSLAIAADEQAIRIIHTAKNKREAERSACIQALDEIKGMLEQDLTEIQTDIQAIKEAQEEEARPLSNFLL